MKKILTLSLVLISFMSASAQTAEQDIEKNCYLSASNYLAYPTPSGKITPAPDGYVPFFIDHYGRHGSRWHIGQDVYSKPLEVLRKANRYGKLTDSGKETLRKLEQVNEHAKKRSGELTPLGAEQHRQIATRMFMNYPDVFKTGSKVDARSTVVIRCILSMDNEAQILRSLNPELEITTDASEADMHILNPMHNRRWNDKADKKWEKATKVFTEQHTKPERFMKQVFNDDKYAADSVAAHNFYRQMFKVASNQQSLEDRKQFDFYDLFTNEELYDMWLLDNAGWYTEYANATATGGRRPFSQAPLLQDFIDKADAAIANSETGASLRFGHEVCVMPLACLMELSNCNMSISEINNIALYWQNYKIYPMGSNIQLIFFRKPGSDDILVKALLNEEEVTLPVRTDCAPFYHWKDLRSYYVKKLSLWDNSKLDFKK